MSVASSRSLSSYATLVAGQAQHQRAEHPAAGPQRHRHHRPDAGLPDQRDPLRRTAGAGQQLLVDLCVEHRLAGLDHPPDGRVAGEDRRDGLHDLGLGRVPVRHRDPADALRGDHVHGAPVGQRRHQVVGQPPERLGHVQRGGQRGAHLGQHGEPALRPLGRAVGGLPLRLRLHPGGHVGLHADEVGQRAVAVVDRRHRHLVPERGAVLAVVEQGDGDRLLRRQRPAQLRHRGPVGRRALQEAAVAAGDLVHRVAGDPGERRVDPDQRVVRQCRVADRERDVGGQHGPVPQAGQHALHLPAAGDGAGHREEDDQRPLGQPGHVAQRETGDPQRLPGRHVTGPAGRGDRLPGDRLAGRDPGQRGRGVRQRDALRVEQAGRVGPGVDPGRQGGVRGHQQALLVRVRHLAGGQVDQQDGGRGLVQHPGQQLDQARTGDARRHGVPHRALLRSRPRRLLEG